MEHLEEFHIPQKGKDNLKDKAKLMQLISEGKNLQEILGYTNQTMEKFYGAACSLFKQELYEESSEAFVFLTTLNPFVYNYWLGLGMSEQLNEEFHGALMAYNMAISVDQENPIPHYHSASCYRAIHDLEKARQSLDLVLACAKDKQEYVHIRERARAAKESI